MELIADKIVIFLLCDVRFSRQSYILFLFDFKETLQSVSQIKTTFFIMVNPLFAPAASGQNLASVADSKQKILSQN